MSYKILLKAIFSKINQKMGVIDRRINKKCLNKVLICMYHRILPIQEVRGWIQDGMYVLPDTFEKQILMLKEKYEIVTLEKYYEITKGKETGKNKPNCIITFDDGWRDFYVYAYPILKKYQVAATVFLPTSYIGTEKMFWTDKVSMALVEIQNNKSKVDRLKTKQKDHTINKIAELYKNNKFELERIISLLKDMEEEKIISVINMINEITDNEPQKAMRMFMNWEEIEEMKNSGIITYGSHTVSHRILTKINDDEQIKELNESKRILLNRKLIDKEFIPFCYPNGNFNDKIVKYLKTAEYHLAVTTKNGLNCVNENILKLKRIGIHQDITKTNAMFGCRITGLL